jgi:hypothetical protein
MKTCGQVEMQIYLFVSELDADECYGSHSGRITPQERGAATDWVGGWMEIRAGLFSQEKRKTFGRVGYQTQISLQSKPQAQLCRLPPTFET